MIGPTTTRWDDGTPKGHLHQSLSHLPWGLAGGNAKVLRQHPDARNDDVLFCEVRHSEVTHLVIGTKGSQRTF
jgi:hypothetical protein